MLRPLILTAALVAGAGPALAGPAGFSGECFREEQLPARYGAFVEKAMVRAPRTYAIYTPPTYETVTERVVVRPGGRSWRVSRDAGGRKVGCWVDVPAEYGTVHRRVMAEPGRLVPYAQAASYGFRSRPILVEPARRGWVPLDD